MGKGNVGVVATVYAIKGYGSYANGSILRTWNAAAMMTHTRVGAALRMEYSSDGVY